MEYSRENFRKCIKCRASVAQDPTISLHRFPKPGKTNSLRCLLWAKYCFPSDAWFSTKFQEKLYKQHKVLCSKHFTTTCFIGRKLFKTAVPGEIENLETPSFGSSNNVFVPVAGPSRILQPMTVNRDITNELDKSLQNEIPVTLDTIKDDKKVPLYRKMRYNLKKVYRLQKKLKILKMWPF